MVWVARAQARAAIVFVSALAVIAEKLEPGFRGDDSARLRDPKRFPVGCEPEPEALRAAFSNNTDMLALKRVKHNLEHGFGLKAVVIGGSITAGQGVKNSIPKTYTGQVEALLRNRRGGKIEFHNHGAHGADACKFAPDTQGVIIPWLADANADLLIIELAINDHNGKDEGVRAAKCLEGIVRICLNWNPRLAVLLVEIPCRKCVGKQLHDFASTISEGSRTLGPWNLRGSKCSADLSSSWPSVFGAASVHDAVRQCYADSVSSISMVHAMSAVMASQGIRSKTTNATSCQPQDIVKAFGGSDGGVIDFWRDYHLGVHAHRLIAEVLVELLTRGAPATLVAEVPGIPISTTFVSKQELDTEFSPLISLRGGEIAEFSVASDCGTNVSALVDMALHQRESPKVIQLLTKCRSETKDGWFAFKGTRVNRFHHIEVPTKNYGLLYSGGARSGQEVALEIDFRDDRSVEQRAGYCALLSFMHSYATFGKFEACAELVARPNSCDSAHMWTSLDSHWVAHESVSRSVPFAFVASTGKLRIRIRLPLPSPLPNAEFTRVFITALELIPALGNGSSMQSSCAGVI